jgi:hypothetical protein
VSFLRHVQGYPPTPQTVSKHRASRRRGRRQMKSIGVQASLGGCSTACRRLAWPY